MRVRASLKSLYSLLFENDWPPPLLQTCRPELQSATATARYEAAQNRSWPPWRGRECQMRIADQPVLTTSQTVSQFTPAAEECPPVIWVREIVRTKLQN